MREDARDACAFWRGGMASGGSGGHFAVSSPPVPTCRQGEHINVVVVVLRPTWLCARTTDLQRSVVFLSWATRQLSRRDLVVFVARVMLDACTAAAQHCPSSSCRVVCAHQHHCASVFIIRRVVGMQAHRERRHCCLGCRAGLCPMVYYM